MADLLTGGGVDRRGAGPGREVRPGLEPGHVTDVADDPSGTDRSDPVKGGIRRMQQSLVLLSPDSV
jgi:hypothetical protein